MKTSPKNVVTNIKGLLGRKFDHEHVQMLRKRKSYDVYEEEDTGNCLIEIRSAGDFVGEEFYFTPEELAAFFLRNLRSKIADRFPNFKTELFLVVLSVPAWFSTTMRSAL